MIGTRTVEEYDGIPQVFGKARITIYMKSMAMTGDSVLSTQYVAARNQSTIVGHLQGQSR